MGNFKGNIVVAGFMKTFEQTFYIKNNLKSTRKESILIILSKWILNYYD